MQDGDYKTCPACGCSLRAKRYAKHMASQHSPEAEKSKALLRAKMLEKLERQKIEGEKIVKCSVCGISIKAKSLVRHNVKAHPMGNNYYSTRKTFSLPVGRCSVCGCPAIPGDNLCSTHSKQ